MKSRWYFSTLVLILAFFGIGKQQISVPNQEIVVQFTDDAVTFDATQNAIAIVKRQLQKIGAEQIQVNESATGGLKITYHSDIDVARIKKLFSQQNKINLSHQSSHSSEEPIEFPSNTDDSDYNLKVCEIHDGINAASDADGFLLEPGLENQRFFNPDLYFASNQIDVKEADKIEKTAYKLRRDVAIEIDNSSHNIPEVRAGPLS